MPMSVDTAAKLLRRCVRFEHLTTEQNVEVIWSREPYVLPWWMGEEMALGYFGYNQQYVLLKFLGRDEEFFGTEALRLKEVGKEPNNGHSWDSEPDRGGRHAQLPVDRQQWESYWLHFIGEGRDT